MLAEHCAPVLGHGAPDWPIRPFSTVYKGLLRQHSPSLTQTIAPSGSHAVSFWPSNWTGQIYQKPTLTGLVSGLSQRLVGSRTVLERGPRDLSDLPSELFIASPALLTTLQLRSTQPCPMPWAAPGLELDCRARSSFLKKLCSVSLVACCCLSRK